MNIISKKKRIETNLTLAGVLLIILAVKWYKSGEVSSELTIPIFLFLIGAIVKPLGDLVSVVWFRIGKVLGWINSRLLLTFCYYLILTPISILYRLNKKERVKTEDSYYVITNKKYSIKDIQNPW